MWFTIDDNPIRALNGAVNEFRDFIPILDYMRKTVQDKAIVTMKQ